MAAAQTGEEKIVTGATWRYLKGTGTASVQPGAWRHTRFDDSGWASGRAPFGYGDGPYGTTLADMRYSYTTRTWTEPARVDFAQGHALRR
ncbi:MAG: hypothetical protein JXR37_05010 [Kiritimatiellae bacterium]|nr:hypothetical protein [Kiritimatiellia bacterium]